MAFAQVTGVVNDANNFPESDVEVTVKGTDKIVYTDENGNFNIDAKVGDTLVINGKEFKVTSTNLGALKYSTEDVSLEEVVVTGYGEVSRETFVGTGTKVDGDVLKRKSSSNVSQALAGEVAGVRVITNSGQPGADATIRVRGFGSVNGSRSPLYVVDGSPYTGNISAINP
ncbi:TonB-dependent receptor plug domain-containing protein, partial [Empedobacter stercoris]|nr:TonB-dependent receptor plug domain-containing protein [Empedobacter stercoris]